MDVSVKTFEQLALEDGDARWELDRGVLRQKPDMSMQHNRAMFELGFQIRSQVLTDVFSVRVNGSHLALGGDSFYIPDVCVVPVELEREFEGAADRLETYALPLPFVAEVWSPSTGSYDVTTKLQRYQLRGDAEIWLVHPFEYTVRAWIRRENTGYEERQYRDGSISLIAVPDVQIDIDALFRPGRHQR
jgi:Uma2 family endonuclease